MTGRFSLSSSIKNDTQWYATIRNDKKSYVYYLIAREKKHSDGVKCEHVPPEGSAPPVCIPKALLSFAKIY